MAELLWRDKLKFSPSENHPSISSAPYHFVTIEHYSPSPGEEGTPDSGSDAHRLIWGDNCTILPALLPEFRAAVDLIYIDPPFMTGRTFTSGDQVAYRDTWGNDLDTYLQWLYETFLQLYQLLSPTGSIYVHLDWRASHYARMLLDELFGSNLQGNGPGFKNEIIWHYQSGGRARKCYARKHDSILLYSKSEEYCFHAERIGERRGAHKRNHMRKAVESDGRVSWSIRSGGREYTYSEDSLMSPSDVWSDINHLHQRDPERTGYATQKPEALLERILLASSEKNDLVLDCFCGSGVTPVVAERLGRRWIACDKSELAIMTTRNRLLAEKRQRAFVLQQCE